MIRVVLNKQQYFISYFMEKTSYKLYSALCLTCMNTCNEFMLNLSIYLKCDLIKKNHENSIT